MVTALAVDETGNLYAGGGFTSVGSVRANGIAMWDGDAWHSLGTGVGGTYPWVRALESDANGNLYVGGKFATAGGVEVRCVAMWDGSAWHALGYGMTANTAPEVRALTVDEAGNLYAGGDFRSAGTEWANNVAMWDGSGWHALGTGTDFGVRALTTDASGNLYAGGSFTTAGGVAAPGIAMWDGGSWHAMGTGMGGTSWPTVGAVAHSGGHIYAGGSFTTAGGVAANNVAMWDGSAWHAVGTGTNNQVLALAADDGGTLYAGGYFTTAGGVATNCVATWAGSAWQPLAAGMGGFSTPYVHVLALTGMGGVYVGGNFATAGSVAATYLAIWDGSAWYALAGGNGLSEAIYVLAADAGDNVYAGGYFQTAGSVAANRVAVWDGAAWHAVGTGTNGAVYSLAVGAHDTVYVGGYFTAAGGTAANRIAMWDGSAWRPLGSGMNSDVYGLAVDAGGRLYAGGRFTAAGGVTASYVAMWDGSAWHALGSGMNDRVWVVKVDASGNVYAGGNFTTAGGATANHVAVWDGTAWHGLGSGVDGSVGALAFDGTGNMYVGGAFATAGGVAASGIAMWDGSTWSAVGGGTNADVVALDVDGAGRIYAGGDFTTAGGVAANHVAMWDGIAWHPLGSGVSDEGAAVAVDGYGNVYVGGWFATAGGKPSANFALWAEPVRVTHMEVTQATQDQGNTIPLIGGKQAMVRVYLDCSGDACEHANGELEVSGNAGRLAAINGPVVLVDVADWTVQRANRDASLNFVIPGSLLPGGEVTFTVHLATGQTYSRPFTLHAAKVVRVAMIPVDYRPTSMEPGCTACGPPSPRVGAYGWWAGRVYPTHAVQASVLPTMPWTIPLCGGDADEREKRVQLFFGRLRYWNLSQSWAGGAEPADHAFGWLPSGDDDIPSGQAESFGGQVAFGRDDDTEGPLTFAHEVGHLLGRRHTNSQGSLGDGLCHYDAGHIDSASDWIDAAGLYPDPPPFPDSRIQDFGFDIPRGSLMAPDTNYDYMSYCGGLVLHDVWTSPWTYRRIYTEKLHGSGTVLAADTQSEGQRYSLTTGIVHTNDEASLEPTLVVTSTANPVNPPTGSDYCLEARDATGAVLAFHCFDLDFLNYERGESTTVDGFTVMLPYSDDVARIVLRRGVLELASQAVTAHAPQVEVVAPDGGEALGATGTYTVTWVASDADGDELTYSVLYSPDGSSWLPVAMAITETRTALHLGDLGGSSGAKIRVLATDGVNTTADESDGTFSVGRKPPQAFLLAPETAAVLRPGWATLLQGRGYDMEDGELLDAALAWLSDLDGVLANGREALVLLSRGRHTVTLRATDSDGNAATGLVSVTVGYDGGDCNGDETVNAGDISADILEIFDGDGSSYLEAPDGTFAGDPVGCDANGDDAIDAGDVSCTILTIFGGPGACGR